MIKIEDIRAKQEEMEKIQKELQGMIKTYEIQEQAKNVYELEYPNKDTVYLLDINRDIHAELFDVDSLYHCDCFMQGNIFETKEQATLESKRRDLLTRFRQFRDKCNGDWVPDFNDENKMKYYICYIGGPNMFDVHYCYGIKTFTLFGYFKNEKDADRAIKLFGDEIKELFVEV